MATNRVTKKSSKKSASKSTRPTTGAAAPRIGSHSPAAVESVPHFELEFPSFIGEESMSAEEICLACHGCCNYVTIPLSPLPPAEESLDTYRWYLLHRNVEIYIDNDGNWELLFKTPCDKLDTKGGCTIYPDRPEICSDYDSTACSRTGKDHQHLFATPEELDRYLKRLRRGASAGSNSSER